MTVVPVTVIKKNLRLHSTTTTELHLNGENVRQRTIKNTRIFHGTFYIADPSSMQDACHHKPS